MELKAERVWSGSCAVENVHVLERSDGRMEIVLIVAGGASGLASWLMKAAVLHDAERRRMEDRDGD
jgi:hypothetical protein